VLARIHATGKRATLQAVATKIPPAIPALAARLLAVAVASLETQGLTGVSLVEISGGTLASPLLTQRVASSIRPSSRAHPRFNRCSPARRKSRPIC
jgi:hypothetical protein